MRKDRNGFHWDMGAIAFGDPFDLISKRDREQEQQEDYRRMYPKPKKEKSKKKLRTKNEML
jgi:hypothetical protein